MDSCMRDSELVSRSTLPEDQGKLFVFAGFMFRMGLAFVTFEEVRPLGVMLSDYCFLLSFILTPKSRLLRRTGSGVLLASSLILSGAFLSLHASALTSAAESLTRLVILFGLIAALAVAHSRDIRKNMFYLVGGISINCLVTVLQASIFPGIVDALSINPPQPDVAFAGRFQGLTEYPVTLGLSAALGMLLGIGLISLEKGKYVRWVLAGLVFICGVAALLSGSRTFLASLFPALIVFALLQKYHRRAIVHTVAGLVVLWGTLTYFVPEAVSQYSDRVDSVGLTDYGRLLSAAQAVSEISEKPILGWGVDHFDEGGVIVIPEGPDAGAITGAHNTFLRYWYAAGLLGATGFLVLFAVPAMRMLRGLKKKMSDSAANALRLTLAAYVFFFIVANLGPYIYNRYLYVPMFVFAGFAANSCGLVTAHRATRQTLARLPTPNIQAAP
jgi:O-antigen ligase